MLFKWYRHCIEWRASWIQYLQKFSIFVRWYFCQFWKGPNKDGLVGRSIDGWKDRSIHWLMYVVDVWCILSSDINLCPGYIISCSLWCISSPSPIFSGSETGFLNSFKKYKCLINMGRTHVRIKGQKLNFYLETHATTQNIYFRRLRNLARNSVHYTGMGWMTLKAKSNPVVGGTFSL